MYICVYVYEFMYTFMKYKYKCMYVTYLFLCYNKETAPNHLSIKNPAPKVSKDSSSTMSDAKSKFILEHSPIMDVYFNLGRNTDAHLCPSPFRVFLSHSPIRYV